MTQEEARRRIAQAAAEGWTELPGEIGKCLPLEALVLGKNRYN